MGLREKFKGSWIVVLWVPAGTTKRVVVLCLKVRHGLGLTVQLFFYFYVKVHLNSWRLEL